MLNIRIALFATLCLNTLSALQVTSEFFPEKSIPKEYYVPNNGDLTLIKLEECPAEGTIAISEERLITGKPTQKGTIPCSNELAPMAVYSLGYIPGEPVKFIFKDENKTLLKEFTTVPSPLYVSSAIDDAKIEATISQINPVIYMIKFTGFQEDELLSMNSISYQERLVDKIPCNTTKIALYMPEVLGKKGGVAKVSYKRPNGEVLRLELPWGLEWIKYTLYMDKGKVKSIIEDKEYLKKDPQAAEYFKSKRS